MDGEEEEVATDWQSGAASFAADVLAGDILRLGLRGGGACAIKVVYSDGPVPVPTLMPLPVAMAVSLSAPKVAAFWIRGQRLPGTLTLTISGAVAQDLTLAMVSSHFDYLPALSADHITLQPGETQNVPFEIVVRPDAWSNQKVDIDARAMGAGGAGVSAAASLEADATVLPIRQEVAFPLPNALLGGFNVASAALGGMMSQPPGDSSGEKPEVLQDGFVGDVNTGVFAVEATSLPYAITSTFSANHP